MKPTDGIVWITGASSGIGAAVALEMANRGWQVAISARSRDKLDKIAELHSNITAIACDVTDRDGMSKRHEKLKLKLAR